MSEVMLASEYARRLVEMEVRRSGARHAEAIPAVARRVKASNGSVWSLLFRPPARVYADLVARLEEAVVADITREIGSLENELVAIRNGRRRLSPGAVAEVEKDIARLRATLTGEAKP